MNGKWEVHGSRNVYENEWATMSLLDVEKPDGERYEHHFVSQPKGDGAAIVIASLPDKGILLMWRHRVVTDSWTWELPGGMIEQGEHPKEAAAREMLEETGWRPGKLRKLVEVQPLPALFNHRMVCFITNEATWEGPAVDSNEAADLAWFKPDEIKELIQRQELVDSNSLAAVLYALQFATESK